MRDLHLDIIFLDLFGVFDATRLSSSTLIHFIISLIQMENIIGQQFPVEIKDDGPLHQWGTDKINAACLVHL